jgi:ribose/xylose/arabinose/galactoside ABC-type transport system permease subunit
MKKFVLPVLLVIELVFFVRLPASGVRFGSWPEFVETFGYYLADVVPQAAPLLVLSLGMTMVLMTAGIDLSAGSMVALIACVMSSFAAGPTFWFTAVPAGLLLALLLGSFNGLLIARLDVPPIIATLGTLFFYRGLCEVVMRGLEKGPFADVPGYLWFGGFTGTVVITGGLLLVGGGYFHRSRWRRELLMLGGNRVAARYAGIPVHRRIVQVYTLMGLLAFVAALCATAHDGSVIASWRTGLELQVIVAVVLGGTRVDGGNGSIVGSVVGVLLIAVLDEGLRGAEMSELKPILLGVLLVVGVWLNTKVGTGARAVGLA